MSENLVNIHGVKNTLRFGKSLLYSAKTSGAENLFSSISESSIIQHMRINPQGFAE